VEDFEGLLSAKERMWQEFQKCLLCAWKGANGDWTLSSRSEVIQNEEGPLEDVWKEQNKENWESSKSMKGKKLFRCAANR